MKSFLLLSILTILVTAHNKHEIEAEFKQKFANEKLTYNSLIRIQNVYAQYYLTSNSIRISEENPHNAITAVPDALELTSLWQVFAGNDSPMKTQSIILNI